MKMVKARERELDKLNCARPRVSAKTSRGHFALAVTLAVITDVQSIVVDKNGVERRVASALCAVRIPERVRRQ